MEVCTCTCTCREELHSSLLLVPVWSVYFFFSQLVAFRFSLLSLGAVAQEDGTCIGVDLTVECHFFVFFSVWRLFLALISLVVAFHMLVDDVDADGLQESKSTERREREASLRGIPFPSKSVSFVHRFESKNSKDWLHGPVLEPIHTKRKRKRNVAFVDKTWFCGFGGKMIGSACVGVL